MEMRRINRDSFWARAEVNVSLFEETFGQHVILYVLFFFRLIIPKSWCMCAFFLLSCQREEEQRKDEERRRASEERRRLERERILKEKKDADERDRKMNEKLQMIEEQRFDPFLSILLINGAPCWSQLEWSQCECNVTFSNENI